jgi:hypothetical protein
MGGQGVLAIPNVYDGWIQNTVYECSNEKKKPLPEKAHGDYKCGKVGLYLDSLEEDQRNP